MSLGDAQQSFSAKSNSPPKKPKNLDVRTREYLTPHEVELLTKSAKKTGRNGFRDFWLITIAYRHALRVSELVELEWSQVDFEGAKLHINRAKGGDESIHWLEGDELRALRKLKRDQPTSIFIFCSERKAPLSTRSVHAIVARAGQAAGIPFPVHPHMLRHGKGYHLVSKGYDTRSIQGYFGHRNIQHTVIYTQLSADRFKGFGKD